MNGVLSGSIGVLADARRHASAAWTPAALSPALWFDAAAITGYANNSSVGTWPDLSGGHHDAVQAGSGLQPIYIAVGINGRPVLRFNGANFTLVIGNVSALFPSAAMLIVVASMGNANGQQEAYSTGESNNSTWSYNGSSYDACFSTTRHNSYRSPTPVGVHCYVTASDATAWRMSMDGTFGATIAGTFSGGPNHQIGVSPSATPLLGDIGEIIALPVSSISTGNHTSLASYLLAKWGVTL